MPPVKWLGEVRATWQCQSTLLLPPVMHAVTGSSSGDRRGGEEGARGSRGQQATDCCQGFGSLQSIRQTRQERGLRPVQGSWWLEGGGEHFATVVWLLTIMWLVC